ncbi:MAG: Formate dehydrogenase subunit beta [Methanosaeta sp. PtaU1.Bin060]|nr:MAG: Formate dehydrogenase subunit beta [Methanosaeta sp. PtaU1.Bin060]
MSAKGDLLYAWAVDPNVRDKGESGGAVTALLTFALQEGIVDAVLGVKKGVDIFDAMPVLITDPHEVIKTAGSIYGGTLLLSKFFGKYLDGLKGLKIAAALKGCDVMGIYEQAKRRQLNLENLLMIGLNCGGATTPSTLRRTMTEVFEVDPESVMKERMYRGHLVIEYDGQQKDISIPKLEDAGYGRRSNCRRCRVKIPRQADLACGQWGIKEDMVGAATFVEVCSDRGAQLVDMALRAGAIGTKAADASCVRARKRREESVLALADKWREKDFSPLSSSKERLKRVIEETSRCIKCYTCVEVCPALFNSTEPYITAFPGRVPPELGFHLLRYADVADSCIDCGQCEELCPMDIPNSLFMHAIEADLEELYGYHAGEDMSSPAVAILDEPSMRSSDVQKER